MPFDMPPLSAGFPTRGRWVIDNLMSDLVLHEVSAAGIVGNISYESVGFTKLREMGQPEGVGGYGWAQWTAARRVMFLAWCTTNSLNWESDEANYRYLVHELKTTMAFALNAVRVCGDLEGPSGSVFIFGKVFEAPGGTTATFLPGYSDRLTFAKEALGTSRVVPLPQANVSQTVAAFEMAAKELQIALKSLNLYLGSVDGIWGPQSQMALQTYKGNLR